MGPMRHSTGRTSANRGQGKEPGRQSFAQHSTTDRAQHSGNRGRHCVAAGVPATTDRSVKTSDADLATAMQRHAPCSDARNTGETAGENTGNSVASRACEADKGNNNNNYLVLQVEMFGGTPSLKDRMTVLSSCRCKSCDL